MPRKIPNSTAKKRKALQLHRAERDGRIDAQGAIKPQRERTGPSRSLQANKQLAEDRRKASALESRFLKLPAEILEHFNREEATRRLPRPIPREDCILLPDTLQPKGLPLLTCPKRPKWRYNSSAASVHKNEEAVFKRWLTETDNILNTIARQREPTYFERNLEVWRQLWRVTEASDMLCILLDIRCPLLHFPPSLANYIQTGIRPRKEVVFVLTKCDLVAAEIVQEWQKYLERALGTEHEPALVICVSNYISREKALREQGTRSKYIPGHQPEQREKILDAFKTVHTKLCKAPVKVASDPSKLARWSPRVKVNNDWQNLDSNVESSDTASVSQHVESIPSGKAEARKARKQARQNDLVNKASLQSNEIAESPHQSESHGSDHEETLSEAESATHSRLRVPEHFRIGLIGAPNVGKSSLLNALLRRKAVRASKTPGKTKHLQTIRLSADVILVDCPGLVSPSYIGMRFQVLASMIPIQSSPFVVDFAAHRMPLEDILGFSDDDKQGDWTTDDLLTSYAIRNGFYTAKAARPDTSRAGAAILRQIHSSVAWAFRPSTSERSFEGEKGISLDLALGEQEPVLLSEDLSEEEDEAYGSHEDISCAEEADLSDDSGSTSDGSEQGIVVAPINKFAALTAADNTDTLNLSDVDSA